VQVLKETKQLCASAVEPLVNGVDAMKQYGVDKVVASSHILTAGLSLADQLTVTALCFFQLARFVKSQLFNRFI